MAVGLGGLSRPVHRTSSLAQVVCNEAGQTAVLVPAKLQLIFVFLCLRLYGAVYWVLDVSLDSLDTPSISYTEAFFTDDFPD